MNAGLPPASQALATLTPTEPLVVAVIVVAHSRYHSSQKQYS
ncbi:hypothetical protein [Thermoflexibacter ruber]|nr:hypothetical protein [Thermoflexibacter ruber]